LEPVTSIFGNNEVSLASVLQKTGGEEAQLILITHQVKEENLRDSLAVIEGMSIVKEINNLIRVEGEN
jgi:homoserine dehydrogenase